MNKNIIMTYNGMNQDISQSKFSNQFYFEGNNIRILSTDSQSTNSVTNEKGNSLILTIPQININFIDKIITYDSKILNYTTQPGEQLIIGHAIGKNNTVLFTTDNNGFDCVWSFDNVTYNLTLLYLRNLNFSINNCFKSLINYEHYII